jgi:hypothetical protein
VASVAIAAPARPTFAERVLSGADVAQASRDYRDFLRKRAELQPRSWAPCSISGMKNRCSYLDRELILDRPVFVSPDKVFEVTEEPLPGLLDVTGPWPEHPIFVAEYSWVPATKAVGGSEAAAALRGLVKSQDLVECTLAPPLLTIDGASFPSKCSIVAIPDQRSHSQVLAECRREKTQTIQSLPVSCTAVLFSRGQQTWLMAVTGMTVNSKGNARVVETVQVTKFIGDAALDDRILLKVADRVLAAEPFSIADRDFRPNLLIANGRSRFSKVLTGQWWEKALVYVSVDSLRLTIDCNVSVNKTNTDRVIDWHPATEGQEAQYCTALRQSIASALEKLCGGPGSTTWDGSKALSCR